MGGMHLINVCHISFVGNLNLHAKHSSDIIMYTTLFMQKTFISSDVLKRDHFHQNIPNIPSNIMAVTSTNETLLNPKQKSHQRIRPLHTSSL